MVHLYSCLIVCSDVVKLVALCAQISPQMEPWVQSHAQTQASLLVDPEKAHPGMVFNTLPPRDLHGFLYHDFCQPNYFLKLD